MPSVGVPLPPPFKGQNDQLPEFSLQNPFCVRMQNFEVEKGIARLRKGHQRFASISSRIADAIASYGTTLFAAVTGGGNTEIYNVTSGAYVLAHTVAGPRNDIASFYFNKRLFLFARTGGNFVAQFDGTTWGAIGYTGPGFDILPGCVHKNRAYFFEINGTRLLYSGIDAIAGALTAVDLATVVSSIATIRFVASISLGENVTQDNVLAVGFSNGEILVYEGSFPNSASWTLVARLQASPVIYENRIVPTKGDAFLITETQILSLRNLISKGFAVEQSEGIGAAIGARYQQIVQSGGLPRGIYHSLEDRIYFLGIFYVDTAGSRISGVCCLVYDFASGSWFEWVHQLSTSPDVGVLSACYHEGAIYAHLFDFRSAPPAVATVYKLNATSTYLDDLPSAGNQGIPFTLKSAPHPLNRFGVVKTDGLEVIMKSDIYPAIDFKLIGDLGAQQTVTQKTSGNGSNVTKTFVNLGIESNLVQYEITGTSTSSTIGIEIYGTNLWVNPSQGVAR